MKFEETVFTGSRGCSLKAEYIEIAEHCAANPDKAYSLDVAEALGEEAVEDNRVFRGRVNYFREALKTVAKSKGLEGEFKVESRTEGRVLKVGYLTEAS